MSLGTQTIKLPSIMVAKVTLFLIQRLLIEYPLF